MSNEIKTHGICTELTDEQAEAASGGAWSSNVGTFAFNVGDTVYTFSLGYYYKGRIVSVNTEKVGAFHKEFTYTVEWNAFKGKGGSSWEEYSKTEADVFESKLTASI